MKFIKNTKSLLITLEPNIQKPESDENIVGFIIAHIVLGIFFELNHAQYVKTQKCLKKTSDVKFRKYNKKVPRHKK